jgi:transposase, IS30 family
LTNIGASNGLLRQYFPKSADLAVYTAEQIHDVAAELNDRPRKWLHDLTPRQAMQRSGHRLNKLLVRNLR